MRQSHGTHQTTPAFAAQDLGQIGSVLDTLNTSAEKVSKSLTKAFADAVINGKSFQDVLKSIATQLASLAVNGVAQSVQQGLTSLLTSTLSTATQGVTPFAEGGIIAQPTFFGTSGGVGLMGERGAEAIVPLARGPDGRLGIAAPEGAQARQGPSITVNIQTPDPQAFRRSDGQISAAIARAVARGQRNL